MDRIEAKEWIDTLRWTGVPVHPDFARKLYMDAGLPIPDHLKPLNLSGAQRHMLMDAWNNIFVGAEGNAD